MIQIPTTRDDPDSDDPGSIAVQGDQPLLVSVDRAAKSLGLGRSYMWSLVRDGDILTVRIGKRVLVPTRELQAYVARLLEQATS